MGRSGATVFLISFVLGVCAFIGTLLFGPVSQPPPRPPLTPEQRAAREREEYVNGVLQNHMDRRQRRLIRGSWEDLAQLSRDVLEVAPEHLWARTDLLHALAHIPGGEAEIAEHARALLGFAAARSPHDAAWQSLAAQGWAHEFLGEHGEAVLAWEEAADLCLAPEGSPNSAVGWYNRAGYLSLAGDRDGALAAWAMAVGMGYVEFDYARVDYDYRDLACDPGFEAVAGPVEERRRAEREAHEAEQERLDALARQGEPTPAEPAAPAGP